MNLKERCEAFAELGRVLKSIVSDFGKGKKTELDHLISGLHNKNQWFTPGNITSAIKAIADELSVENIEKWVARYPGMEQTSDRLTAGIIMAGNIPLVGFHDFLCVLITGNKALIKTSSKDADLIYAISDILCRINPGFREMISFTDGTLSGFDVVIATGSNNSSRYFEYYFRNYPHIIRKNRNSVAIIEGDETREEIKRLGYDIFSYFGLGCRNVSKIFIPAGYEISELTKNWEEFSEVIFNTKYANNYEYYKAIYLVNREPFTDTGYLLLREDSRLASPVSVLYYEYYSSYENLLQLLSHNNDSIQCTVSKKHTPFGTAQMPALWDYADGIDTIEFLLKKNSPGRL